QTLNVPKANRSIVRPGEDARLSLVEAGASERPSNGAYLLFVSHRRAERLARRRVPKTDIKFRPGKDAGLSVVENGAFEPTAVAHRRADRLAGRLGQAARPLSLLGSGKSNGRGAKGVGPSHRENGNGQQRKGFSAKTITYRSAGNAAQEREREQD